MWLLPHPHLSSHRPPLLPFVLLLLRLIKESVSSESVVCRGGRSFPRLAVPAGWRVTGRPTEGRGLSVAGGGDDADVQEVVRVAEVLAEPLQRRLQQRLDAVDHHLVALLLTCRWVGGAQGRWVSKDVFLQ